MKRLIYDVPRWHCFLHREARGLDAAQPWDSPELKLADELFDRLYAGEPEGGEVEGQVDLHQRWAQEFHRNIEQLPSFQRLATECQNDAIAAASAAEALTKELKPTPPDPNSPPSTAPRRGLASACQRASQAVEEVREALEGLGEVAFGRAAGFGREGARPSEGSRSRPLATRLKNDNRLLRIALLAGRFKRIAAAKQRQKVKHGAEEITDVELGGALARLLPVELAKLRRPRFRLALLRDLVERRAMQYQLSGAETLGKGPLVVCLDKSGSMDGPPDIWATAVALALLDIAKRQQRPFALLGFDGGVKFEALVQPHEPLPEEGLFVSCSGGTSIANVLSTGLSLIRRHPGALKKADVVLITDGESDTAPAAELRAVASELGVTVLGFGIGVEARALEPWCDEVQTVTNLAAMDDATAEKLFTV